MTQDYAKQWGEAYNKANIVFTSDVKSVMNSDSTAGRNFRTFLQPAVDSVSLLSALCALDEISLEGANERDRAALPANIKKFTAALATLASEKKKYLADVDDILKLTIPVPEKNKNGEKLPRKIKEGFPQSYRHLKILKTTIEAIYAKAEQALDGANNRDELRKINEKKIAAMDKAESEEQRKAIQEEARFKNFLLMFSKAFKSSMMKGGAAIQRMKAAPTREVYNAEMSTAGRDIAQNMNNVAIMKKNPKFKSHRLLSKLPDPGPLADELTPYADGKLLMLPTGTSDEDVKKHLANFVRVYKAIAAQYAQVLAGKFD